MPFPRFVKGHVWGTLIGVNFRSQGDRQGRPYSPTHRFAKPVYSRGDPGGRPFGVPLYTGFDGDICMQWNIVCNLLFCLVALLLVGTSLIALCMAVRVGSHQLITHYVQV